MMPLFIDGAFYKMNTTYVVVSRHPHAKSELRNTGETQQRLTQCPQRQGARTRSCEEEKGDCTHPITDPGSQIRRVTPLRGRKFWVLFP